MTMMSFHIKSKAKVMCWNVSTYLPGSSVQLLRSCLICLSSKRKGLWTRVGLNSPPVSTKGHTSWLLWRECSGTWARMYMQYHCGLLFFFSLPRKSVVTTHDILEPSHIWYILSTCHVSGALHTSSHLIHIATYEKVYYHYTEDKTEVKID